MYDLIRSEHLLFQSLGVDNKRLGRHVILYNGIKQCRLLKEIIVLKGMELIKLHGIYTELSLNTRLENKTLIPFIGHHLNGYLTHIVENITAKLLYKQFRSEERRVGKECRSRWSPYH